MPQKRKKGLVRRSRALPQKPPGDEGNQLTAKRRAEKISLMMNDFDAEVKARIAQMRSVEKQFASQLKSAHHLELLKLPQHVREMKLSEYLSAGGSMEVIALLDARQVMSEITSTSSVMKPVGADSTRRLPNAPHPGGDVSVTVPAGGATAARARKGRKADGSSMAPPPPPSVRRTTRRTTKQSMVTPLRTASAVDTWDTPLVTPRFDPRLLVTPAGRNIAGHVALCIPVDDNSSVVLIGESVVTISNAPTLDGAQLEEMVLLHRKMTILIEKNGGVL